jgi:hypothetical protein
VSNVIGNRSPMKMSKNPVFMRVSKNSVLYYYNVTFYDKLN